MMPSSLAAGGPFLNAYLGTMDLDEAEESPRQTFIFPCKLAVNRSNTIHPDQPGTILDQTEAALVRAESRWCPRLHDLASWAEAQRIDIGYPRMNEL